MISKSIVNALRAPFAVALAVAGWSASGATMAQQQTGAPLQRPAAVFRSGVDLVTVNVVVRDRNGAVVRGLTRDDFTILEDNKPQTIATFDFEEIESPPSEAVPAAVPTVLGRVGQSGTGVRSSGTGVQSSGTGVSPVSPTPLDLHGRRLIAMLFDLSSMQPGEMIRSAASARDYIEKRLTPADMVAIATLSTTLQVLQDFTSDRDALLGTIDRLSGVEGAGFDEPVATDPTDDSATAFAPDDAEFTLFNTDRRLQALQALTDAMAGIEQKKSLVYFSSGMAQSGMDNRVAMRTVIDHAVRANVSIYAADMRGLQALGPAGDASQASTRGQSAFSGRAVSGRFDTMAASQDALSSLAEDTGGRAFFDQNDVKAVFDRVVADSSAYYLLGFTSSNRGRDGRFRRIKVGLKRPDLELEYRAGYYAPRDFAHSGRDDREQQLTEQLFSDLSVTDLPVYASSAYFRLRGNRYFVPLWVVVPGSKVPFATSRDKDRATIDVMGFVRDGEGRPVARIRDTISLSVAATEAIQRKNVQYQSDLELPAGTYSLKVVVRENATGTMGSFEGALNVPDLSRVPMRVSSVVVGTRLQAAPKKEARNPLVQNGQELVPSIAHVVPAGQRLYFYYEMYDAAAAAGSVRVLSNVVFFRGQKKVFETSLVEATAVSAPDRKAVTFQLDVPTDDLPPGLYTCQLTLIDDIAGTFAFPRLPVFVRR
ncbi:MAG TPA: VWA domain-containing protein [Vicinamibacterales bacterium]